VLFPSSSAQQIFFLLQHSKFSFYIFSFFNFFSSLSNSYSPGDSSSKEGEEIYTYHGPSFSVTDAETD